ncbi:MAG: FHA domain-containing protein [Nitrospirae bacterium]|nr:FHA domain-containing protein [Nitrospirota bacterium]MBF0541262.1 FHA domain-containing protein [Nitrospirota bacterium]
MAKLLLKFKGAILKELPLDKDTFTIGRKPNNDIQIDNLAVSSFHAKVFKDGDYFYLEDQNSLNGTFVNGKKISKLQLQNGDNAIIGKHTLTFVADESTGVESPPSQRFSMDETLVLDPKLQQEILSQQSKETAPTTVKKDALGGFRIIEGSTDSQDYLCKDRISTIGKDNSALIRLKGMFKSKIAALINRRQEGYFISPSGGGKPIKVNNKDVFERHELKDGDVVEVEGVRMQFYVKE